MATVAPKYIISKFVDPLFAVTIGLSAAYVRISREERGRLAAGDLDGSNATFEDLKTKVVRRVQKVDAKTFVPDWTGEKQAKEKRWGIVEPGSE